MSATGVEYSTQALIKGKQYQMLSIDNTSCLTKKCLQAKSNGILSSKKIAAKWSFTLLSSVLLLVGVYYFLSTAARLVDMGRQNKTQA